MTGRRILTASLIFALTLGGTGCSNPSQPETSEPPTEIVRVQGVTVTPQVVQLLAIGETKQLAARISPLDATDQALAWESSDPAVATVDGSGLVTAIGVGAGVFITAYTHDGRHQASANVSVLP
jgi:uncharacterized protein YjdB